MHVYIKYGASVAALLATLSLAQAQSEHQGGGEKGGGAVEQAQPERGKQGAAQERAPAAQERSQGETRASAPKEKQPAEHREGERSAQERAPAAQEHSKGETRASSTNEKQPAEVREGERKAQDKKEQDKKENQRQSNAAGAAVHRPNIHIGGIQKTKLHDAVSGSKAFRHYHASEIHFTVEVGTRVPDDVIYYDAPVQFIAIDPEFSGYKIVVLDDEILVIDPDTREIVEVVPI